MKTHIRITSGLPSVRENPELISRLVSMYPEAAQHNSFFMDLPENDPRAIAVIKELAENGLHPWKDHRLKRQSNEYGTFFHREYDDTDFAGVALLRLAPWVHLVPNSRQRDQMGRLQIEYHKPHLPKDPIATDGQSALLIRDSVKRAIESINPKHLLFREAILVTWWDHPAQQIVWQERGEEPWWEITSDLTLPPMSPSMTLQDVQTLERLPRSTVQICFARDPNDPRILDSEYHYCRSEIESFESFDAALTHERVGGSNQLLLSIRVYHALQDAGISSRWIPCRLDEC